ncbi:hypothetical protein Sme01_00770 [Sphaerisporangium melleum]|uniref:Secreted protein n=1 Tax=Sphaerisporangium melleum TaxID=321316 RepID=A0A917RIX1_9ACTN|nr:hypothetical protein [Sphaerisporangium melleum]GGL09791.1 hypothetical protein GCM10007964_59990 [Sphaerisporangium melleum]GII67601.1 hypothetical protein Sme01_00770 [Sphaerisporangium melleum]
MSRRLPRRALSLCVLLTGVLTGSLVRATSEAHAHAEPPRPRAADRGPAGVFQESATARLQSDGSLSDVAGLSKTDIWAVGQEDIWEAWQNRSVITHWDGAAWTEAGIRNDASGAGHLRSVAAAKAGEIWAVGEGHDGLPYVVRGDGSVFDRVSVPQLGSGDWLGAVAAVPGRMVAVGGRDDTSGETGARVRYPLFATATAKGWTAVRAKTPGTLYGVALTRKGEGWAAGDGAGHPLIMRLSGSAWKRVALPDVPGGYLRDIAMDGPKKAVAVGGVYRDGEISPLILEWNGKRWRRASVPERHAELYGVTADGKGHFWASGFDPAHPRQAYLLRGGQSWRVVRGATTPTPRTVRLQAVTHVGDLTLAVGHVVDAAGRYTDIIERFLPTTAKAAATTSGTGGSR